jgi:hypothetical protein
MVAAAAHADGGNGIAWRRVGRLWPRGPPSIVLALPEVAALFPSPGLRLPILSADISPAARTVPLARSSSGRVWGLPIEPQQGRHALFLGETGMGKSTALLQATVRAAELGGVVFFDPIGDTSRRLLDRLPSKAVGRVTWVSPAVSPVGVNALAGAARPGPAGDRALADLVQALRRVRAGRYADSPFWGPRVEEMVHLALRAASRYPNGTIREAAALLRAEGSRERGVPPAARDAVQELSERVRSRPEELDGARRVLDEVLRSPVLARMLAAGEATFSVATSARAGGIVVVSGDAPEVGESAARLLLSVHLAMLWSDLLARGSSAKVFVVADEIQWFANESAVELWRLGRRFNVHLWAATQSLASLSEPVREAALTNSADLVVFRGSPDDARELARWVGELSVETTLSLRRGEAAVLIGKGADCGWVRLPFEPERPRPDRWRQVWEQSRELWAAPEEVDVSPVPGRPESSLEEDGSDRARAALVLLWAGLVHEGDPPSVTVRLDELRSVLDADADAVRLAGGRLAAARALETTDTPLGRSWTVRRDPLGEILGNEIEPGELAEASERWARLVAARAHSDSRKGL